MDVFEETNYAEERIMNYLRKTPLDFSLRLSELTDTNIYLKLENIQYTGSFKVRGALSKVSSLSVSERQKGLVVASTGNMGVGFALAMKFLGGKGIIYVPHEVDPLKIEKLEQYDVEIVHYGDDCLETERFAREQAEQNNHLFISPYNDPQVIGGQGTIGFELIDQLPEIDHVFVSVGGGGLISGIAGYLKTIKPTIKVTGCLPENSPVMSLSVQAGEIIDYESKPTISDGTAGGIEKGAITFSLCQKLVDNFVHVSEEEIKNAMRLIFDNHGQVIEGAAGVAVAGLLKESSLKQPLGSKIAVIICGGNISIDTFKQIICLKSP
ncbi:MAG: threonine/serine dehydratase [Candidatus Heimdallarchaeota archaeon]|nr:threonine/serine dehydratase [Candidatus Heimdallarchaeota archaeon]MCK5049377.1 threonine/serine dehydratase [Candidatus Heimdallarchaeota archaeon]